MSEVVIKIPANFSVDEAIVIRESAYKMIENGEKEFLMDFSHCSFVDSTGLGVMVGIYKKCAERGGRVTIGNVQPQVRKIIEMTRLDKVFEIK